MKYLITGAAGFIGSHLVDSLLQIPGSSVVAIDNLYRGRLENIATHLNNPAFTFLQVDLRDEIALINIVKGIDIVYHLGAQSNVMGAFGDPDYSFQTNVVGTYNVLKASRQAEVRRVVFTSSREVYGEALDFPVEESRPLNAKNLYGVSKTAAEMYCRVFRENYGLDIVILRLANVYGPRDVSRVIPIWLERAAHNEPLIVYGGQQIIDFIWIGTIVDALLHSLDVVYDGKPVNIGSGQGVSILELAQRIIKLMNSTSPLEIQPPRSMEVVGFIADITRMKHIFGLEPPQDPLSHLSDLTC